MECEQCKKYLFSKETELIGFGFCNEDCRDDWVRKMVDGYNASLNPHLKPCQSIRCREEKERLFDLLRSLKAKFEKHMDNLYAAHIERRDEIAAEIGQINRVLKTQEKST